MNYAVRSGNFSAARFVVSDMKHVSAAILAALAMVTSSGCGSDPEEVTATATEATAISGPTSPQTTSSAEVVGWAPILYATPRADDRLLLEFGGGPSPGVPENPCSADFEITVTEDAEAVIVTVAIMKTPELVSEQEQSGLKCPSSQSLRSEEVTLQSPLDSRAVIDGHTQRQVDTRG